MISRIWHGWTTPENANHYQNLLKTEIFPTILAKKVAGLQKIELMRRASGDEIEFMTIMWFDSLGAVKQFAGEQYETAYVPEKARQILARFDSHSQHYQIEETVRIQ